MHPYKCSCLLQACSSVARLMLFAILLLLAVCGQAAAESLQSQLESIAEQQGFELSGQHQTATEPARWQADGQAFPISVLLAEFNHVLLRATDGKLIRVIIMSRKQALPPQPPRSELQTRRQGSHHLIKATLIGLQEASIAIELLIDTGSTYVVLPRSMVEKLGFTNTDLEERELHTAKGLVDTLVGELQSVRVGDFEVEAVGVAFIADEDLGGHALLGMTFLSQFQVTLDDTTSRLILKPGARQDIGLP